MPERPSPVLADERRREILKILKQETRVSVQDLSRRFNVSAVTLRTDLGQLARQGLAVRAYGGAMLPQDPDHDFPLSVKTSLHHAEKVRIGTAACQFIKPHQTVILDSGTTAAEVARAIKRTNPPALTVITHALNIAQELTDAPHISVIMIGGLMRHVAGSFVGPQAERMIQELHADHFFLGVDGLDAEVGLSTPDLLEAQLNTQMMKIAQEVTVIADSSKFAKRSLSVISDISRVKRIITDSHINPEILDRFRQRGLEMIVV